MEDISASEEGYQFVDTNVLVYAHDLSAGSKHARARYVILNLWESEAGCLSIQVTQEFYVTVTQKVVGPLDYVDVVKIISDLSYWRVHEPKLEDVLGAIDLGQCYQISFWDAMIIQSADQLGCQTIWLEDLNPGQVYAGIELLNPFS